MPEYELEILALYKKMWVKVSQYSSIFMRWSENITISNDEVIIYGNVINFTKYLSEESYKDLVSRVLMKVYSEVCRNTWIQKTLDIR